MLRLHLLTVVFSPFLLICFCQAGGSFIFDSSKAINCFIGISTGPPSKVALLLSSFTTHVSPHNSTFVLLTTRAAEHESFFAHLAGRVEFVSIQFPDADMPILAMKRFDFYLDFLLQSGASQSCTNVMYTDTYDVFFQGDPFDSHRYSDVLTFTTESKHIGEDIWNAQWIYNCYGLDTLLLLHNKTIANGGVTFGPYKSMLTYTGHLLDEFDARSFFARHHPGVDGNGLFRYGGFVSTDSEHSCWTDQGFLNYLLHVPFSESQMHFAAPSNFENAVFTVGHNHPEVHFQWRDNTLFRLHSDGHTDVPAVVHQLNRFQEYWTRVLDLYAVR
jgi:hypothetical protein